MRLESVRHLCWSCVSRHLAHGIAILDVPIVEGDARVPTKDYEFADIMTPLGYSTTNTTSKAVAPAQTDTLTTHCFSRFNLHVKYRLNCDFQVDDMERDLSARFIDMDEHYFTPTMAKYQQEQDMQRTRSASSYETGSTKTKTTMTGLKPVSINFPRLYLVLWPLLTVYIQGSLPSAAAASSSHEDQEPFEPANIRALADEYSDPREIVQQRQREASMTSMSSVSPVNRERLSFTRTSGVEVSTASIGRKTSSAANVSPFKSPSLSSSPIQGGGTGEFPISHSKYYTSPTGGAASASTRNLSYHSSTGDEGASSSSRKVEFSSSFDRYKGSPNRGDIGTGMSRRLSRNSDHSLVDIVSWWCHPMNSLSVIRLLPFLNVVVLFWAGLGLGFRRVYAVCAI